MKLALKYRARIFMASIDFGNHTNAHLTGRQSWRGNLEQIA
jgi:hypothetical protein